MRQHRFIDLVAPSIDVPMDPRELADVRIRNAVQAVENALVEMKVAMKARDRLVDMGKPR